MEIRTNPLARIFKNSILLLLFFCCHLLQAQQYLEFPKLRQLYEQEKYEACITSMQQVAKDNPKEPEPYYWALLSAIEIAGNPGVYEEYGKSAINKSLQYGEKLAKKDRDKVFTSQLEAPYAQLKTALFEECKALEKKNNWQRIQQMLSDFVMLTDDAEAYYQLSLAHRQLKQDNEADERLKRSVTKTWKQFREKKSVPASPVHFAKLAAYYMDQQNANGAKDVLNKGFIIYKQHELLKAEVFRQMEIKSRGLRNNDDKVSLQRIYTEVRWTDSISPGNPVIKTYELMYDSAMVRYYARFEQEDATNFYRFVESMKMEDKDVFLMGFINDTWIRRTEGGLTNLVNMIFGISCTQFTQKDCVRDLCDKALSKGNYEGALSLITFYSKQKNVDQKTLNDIKSKLAGTLVKTVQELPAIPASFGSLETLLRILPENKTLRDALVKKQVEIFSAFLEQENYRDFFYWWKKALPYMHENAALKALNKKAVIEDYNANYLTSLIPDVKSMHVVDHIPTCNAGKVSDSAQELYRRNLSYYRRLAGICDTLLLSRAYSEAAQEAALMMMANNELNHQPPKTWKCYTDKGERGAGASNLSLGSYGTQALGGMMADNGESNYSVGHRRWILNPYQAIFGHGSVTNASALYVFGFDKDFRPYWNNEDMIAWPPAGYCPLDFVYDRWSFSLANANFSGAVATVKINGKNKTVKQEKLVPGYALNTLAWRIDGYTPGDNDVCEVTISQVFFAGDEKPHSYKYYVYVVKP